MTKMKLTALKVQQNNHNFYMTVINSEKLKDFCFITRRNEDKEEGFQRLLNKARANLITKYYEKGGTIPSPLILSAKREAEFSYDSNSKEISFLDIEKIFMVIDGQHRFFGINDISKDLEVPVIIFNDLDLSEEVNLFIDINTNQKGVPSALLLDIKSLAQKETTTEEKQRELFEIVNSSEPLKEKLLPDSSRTGYISRTAFNEATKDIFESSVISGSDNNIIFKTVINYLKSFDKMYKESSSNAEITKTIFFKVAFNLFNDIIEQALNEYGNVKTDSIYEIISNLAAVDYTSYTGTNKQTESDLTKVMKDVLFKRKVLKLSAEDLF